MAFGDRFKHLIHNIGSGIKHLSGADININDAPGQFATTGNQLHIPTEGTAAPYMGAQGQTDYANQVAQGLGIKPAETSAAIYDAGKQTLNADAHAGAVADAARLSQMGQNNSGTAAALASRAGASYAGQDANLKMAAEKDAADRNFQTQQLLAGLGQQQAQAAGQFGLQNAQQVGQNAQTEWGANVGMPMTIAAGNKAGQQQFFGGLINGGLQAIPALAGA